MDAQQQSDQTENIADLAEEHKQLLRIAFEHVDEALWNDDGIFATADALRLRGLSFGQGDLRFNRTLNVFYLAQIAASIYRFSDQTDEDFPTADDFDDLYKTYNQLLSDGAWKQYYTLEYLLQPATVRYWRLPNLRDLPDGSDPLGQPRTAKGTGHFTKLPRWAHTVVRIAKNQQSVSHRSVVDLATSTLHESIARLQKQAPDITPYSETQTRFWLERMGINSPPSTHTLTHHPRHCFAVAIAQGGVDMHAWEAHYSSQRWYSVEARLERLAPDLDGTQESEIMWCGMPDGGIGVSAQWRGWEPELGSEEEIMFLAALAVNEVESVPVEQLDLTVQSQVLFAVLIAVRDPSPEARIADLRPRLVKVGSLDEKRVDAWLREVMRIMDAYSLGEVGQVSPDEDRLGLFRRILLENGQLFAEGILPTHSGHFEFALNTKM